MTVLKKISVINENKSSKYSILIGNNFIKTLEKNFSKTLKGRKIYVIYDEFFHKLQLHKNLIKDFEKVSTKLIIALTSCLKYLLTFKKIIFSSTKRKYSSPNFLKISLIFKFYFVS